MLHRNTNREELGTSLPFELEPRRSFHTACPLCSPTRTKKNTKSLSVYRDEDSTIRYKCHYPGCENEKWHSVPDPEPEFVKKAPVPPKDIPVPAGMEVPEEYLGNKLYWYRDLEGRYLFANRRIDVGSTKLYVPFIYTENGFVTGKQAKWPENYRGLYGAETIKGKTKAVIVEGEKAAEAAKKIFKEHAVVSWKGGANNLKSADWSLLQGIDTVLLWPDNDAPGKEVMYKISRQLPVGSIKMADVSHLPAGADLADDLSLEDIKKAIQNSHDLSTELEGVFTLEDIDAQLKDVGVPRSSGFDVLDASTKLPRSGLAVIEGRTKHGKSALAVALTSKMLELGLENNIIFYSYEMTAAKVYLRYLKTLDPSSSIESHQDSQASNKVREWISKGRLKIVDQGAQISIGDITTTISKPQYRNSIVVIDYLQIVPTRGEGYGRSRQLLLKGMLDELRVAAHKNKVLVMCLSQLTPDYVDPRNDSPREAKDIHYSADLVIRVWNKKVGERNPDMDNISGDYIVHTYLNRDGECNVKYEGSLKEGSQLKILRRAKTK